MHPDCQAPPHSRLCPSRTSAPYQTQESLLDLVEKKEYPRAQKDDRDSAGHERFFGFQVVRGVCAQAGTYNRPGERRPRETPLHT